MARNANNLSGTQALKKVLKELEKRVVRVGWFENAVYAPDAKRGRKGGLPVAIVAYWLNGGTVRMPARPFFTEAVTVNQAELRDLMRSLVRQCMAGGMTPEVALGQVGLYIEGKVIENIKSQRYADCSDAYNKWKEQFHAEPQTLIDTGTLWQTLVSKVEMDER